METVWILGKAGLTVGYSQCPTVSIKRWPVSAVTSIRCMVNNAVSSVTKREHLSAPAAKIVQLIHLTAKDELPHKLIPMSMISKEHPSNVMLAARKLFLVVIWTVIRNKVNSSHGTLIRKIKTKIKEKL